MFDEKLSANFTRREFACTGKKCCGHSAPVESRLVAALQELRDVLGVPLRITSGFRCNVHNAEVRGAPESQHTVGAAADVAIPRGMTPRQLADAAEKVEAFRLGGIGLYPTWVHVDVRTNGPARW